MNDDTLPHSENALVLYDRLQNGILARSGGWLDQPLWYTDDMRIIALLREWHELPHIIKRNQQTIQDMLKRT